MSVSSIPAWLGAPLFAFGTLIFAFVPYVLLRRVFAQHSSEDSQNLSDSVWEEYFQVETALLRLEPHDLPQQDLRPEMLADWDDVSGFRLAGRTGSESS